MLTVLGDSLQHSREALPLVMDTQTVYCQIHHIGILARLE